MHPRRQSLANLLLRLMLLAIVVLATVLPAGCARQVPQPSVVTPTTAAFATASLPLTGSQTKPPLPGWTTLGVGPLNLGTAMVALLDGKVLLVGQSAVPAAPELTANLVPARLYDPVQDQSWTLGPAHEPRFWSNLTRLSDGRVLISGGWNGATRSATAEVFDPQNGSFSPTGAMGTPRARHKGLLLLDGRVLVYGGSLTPANLEVWDPASGAFAPGPMLDSAQPPYDIDWGTSCDAGSAVLSDGTVLLVGGCDSGGQPTTATWRYDPATGKLSQGPATPSYKNGVQVAALPGNKALIAGWTYPAKPADALNLLDVTTGTFAAAFADTTPHWLLPLSDGKVLLQSPWEGAGVQIFDPATGGRVDVPELWGKWVLPLPNGDVVALGRTSPLPPDGDSAPHTVRYVAASNSFVSPKSIHELRTAHIATLLSDGRIMLVGGQGGYGGNTGSCIDEVFNPANGSYKLVLTEQAYPNGYGPSATRLGDGRVLVCNVKWPEARLFDPKGDTWQILAPPPHPVQYQASLRLPSGAALLLGGMMHGVEAVAQRLDPATLKWSQLPWLRQGREWTQAVLLADGRVVLLGGITATNSGKSVEWLDPESGARGEWSPLQAEHYGHQALQLGDGKVLLTGTRGEFGSGIDPPSPFELWDPATGNSQLATDPLQHDQTAIELLPDGTVLVTGTCAAAVGQACTAERFDPHSLQFTPLARPLLDVPGASLTRLSDGRVVRLGGLNLQYQTSDDVYDSRQDLGEACTSDAMCQSGHCAGGTCCATACNTPPAGCSLAVGQCSSGICQGYGAAPKPSAPQLEPVANGSCGGPMPILAWQGVTGLRYDVVLNGKTIASDLVATSLPVAPTTTLAASNTWSVTARANCAGAAATSTTGSFAWQASPLSKPVLTSPTAGAKLAVCTTDAAWTAASADATYELRDGTTVLTSGIQATKLTLSGLATLGEGPHSLVVVARNCLGQSVESEPVSFQVAAKVTDPPVLLTPGKNFVTAVGNEVSISGLLPANAPPTAVIAIEEEFAGKTYRNSGVIDGDSFGGVSWAELGMHHVRAVLVGCGGDEVASPWTSYLAEDDWPKPFELLTPPYGSWLGAPGTTLHVAWEPTTDPSSWIDKYQIRLDDVVVATVPADVTATDVQLAKPLSQGPHKVSVFAWDAGGHGWPAGPNQFLVDLNPPTAFALISPKPGALIGTAAPQFAWQASTDAFAGLAGYRVQLDGQQVADVAAKVTNWTPASNLAAGPHTWTIVAVDKAGNTTTATPRSFVIDSEAPQVPMLQAITPTSADGAWVTSATPVLRFASSDGPVGSGVTVVALAFDDGNTVLAAPGNCCAAPQCLPSDACASPPQPLADGKHTWQAAAFDAAGLASTVTAGEFWVDTTPPAAPLLQSPLPGAELATPLPTFCWDLPLAAESPPVKQHLLIRTSAGQPVASLSVPLQLGPQCAEWPQPGLEPGVYLWTVDAVDAAGLASAATPAQLTLTADTTPPAFALVPPAATWQSEPSVTLQWSPPSDVSGVCSQQLWLDGQVVALPLAATAWQADLSDGVHKLELQVVDCAGNSGLASALVGVDTQAPVVELPAVASCSALASVTVAPACSDSGSGVAAVNLIVDGKALPSQPTATSLSSMPLSQGMHTVAVACADLLGHMASSPTASFQVDASPPAVVGALLSPVATGIQVQVKAMDVGCGVADVAVAVDGADWQPAAQIANSYQYLVVVASTSAGNHALKLRVRDQADHSVELALSFTVGPCWALGSCDLSLGTCSHPLSNSTPCDDGNPCTTPDLCSAGTCTSKPLICNDGLANTADACLGGECHAGQWGGPCATGSDCSDGLACTQDLCITEQKLCLFEAIAGCCMVPSDCGDGQTCLGGVCSATPGGDTQGEDAETWDTQSADADTDDTANADAADAPQDVAADLVTDSSTTGLADSDTADAPSQAQPEVLGDLAALDAAAAHDAPAATTNAPSPSAGGCAAGGGPWRAGQVLALLMAVVAAVRRRT